MEKNFKNIYLKRLIIIPLVLLFIFGLFGVKAYTQEKNFTGLAKDESDGQWYHLINGVHSNYTGLASNEYGWWYVNDGKIDWQYTGIVCNEYGWWYVINGAIDFDYSNVIYSSQYGWCYIHNGCFDTGYSGVASNEYGWWKITNGIVDFEYTGVAGNEYGWWYIKNGALDLSYTGVAPNEYGWWKITDGAVDFGYTGIANNEYGWWYIKNGAVDWSYNQVAGNDAGWWKITNGAVDFGYTGAAYNEAGWWYIVDGKVDFSYNGSVMIEDVEYDVISGSVQGIEVPKNKQESIGALHVQGSNLVNEVGDIVQLKGLSTHGINWFPQYVNYDCFRQLKEDFNINVIRLAMYTAEYNGYCAGGNQDDLKQLVEDGVSYATELGMYTIIDWHVLNDKDPNVYKDEAIEFFDEMSKKYISNPYVIFEICNEPNGGTSWSDIKSYAQDVLNVIRGNGSNAVVIVGTPNWSQYVDQAADDRLDYENVMYALHFYAATHKESLRNTMVDAINSGLPVFVTEFGICDASGNGGIDEEQASQWISVLNEYDVSYCMWNISNKNETSSIFNSSCDKVCGFTVDDLSDSGKWFLNLCTGQISLPEYIKSDRTNNNASNNNEQNNSQNTSQNNSTNNSQTSGQEDNGIANVTVKAEYTSSNSWNSEGRTFTQYNIKIINNSGEKCSSWNAVIDFGHPIKVEQGWCANLSVDGNCLYITSQDYNAKLDNGQSVDGIGVIISQ